MKPKQIDFTRTRPARIAGTFLRSHHLSVLTLFIIFVSGIVGFIIMPKQYNPEITAPAFVITTDFPNATSRDVYDLITRPMEDKLREIPAMDEISSQSLAGGRSIVSVRFIVGSNEEKAQTSLNQKLHDNMDLTPLGAKNPIVKSLSPDDVPIYTLAITSPKDSLTTLRKTAWDIADELKRVPGTSNINVIGGETDGMQVSVSASLLADRGVTLPDVISAIQNSNSAGNIFQLSSPDGNSRVNVSGYAGNANDFKKIIVKNTAAGPIRVEDVANVTYGAPDITDFVSLKNTGQDDRNAVFISIAKLKGKNIMNVASAIDQKVTELKKQPAFSDVNILVANDQGTVTSREIGRLTEDLVKSIIIVGLTLLLLLGARSAGIVSLSIPLVLLSVFAIGSVFGQTINRITLFALILSLGLLVDDAIVVVENIARYLKNAPADDPRPKISIVTQAVGEVGTALIMSTLTMILAFLPMAFVTGMMGPYMRPIPFFVPVALLASLFFALTLNPYLAYIFIPKGHVKKETFFARHFSRLSRRYGIYLKKLLDSKKRRRRWLFGVAVAIILSLSLPFFKIVLFRMLPKADRDQFYVYIDLNRDANIGHTYDESKNLEKIILQNPNVERTEATVGTAPIIDFNGLFRGSSQRVQEDQATIKVVLKDADKRSATSEQIAKSTRQALADYTKDHPDDKTKIVEDPPGPPVMSTLYLKVEGPQPEILNGLTQDFKKIVTGISGTVDIDTSLSDPTAEYNFQIDSEKAKALGTTPAAIASYLQAAVTGVPVGIYHSATSDSFRHAEQESILVRFAPADRKNISDFTAIKIPTPKGTVSLESLLKKDNSNYVQDRILSDDYQTSEFVSAEMSGRSVVYAILDLFSQARKTVFSNGLKLTSWNPYGVTLTAPNGENYHVLFAGEWKLTLNVFRDLGIVMLIVAFLIYSVLTLQSNSFTVSLLIMASIPLTLVGILPGFAVLGVLKGTYFSATSMIGVIALSGLTVKNVIIYLEYVEPLLEEGLPLKDALVEAGRIRLLPIILTSLTAILGSLTIIADPIWEGLAWSIIFGLTASTALTMLVFPMMYYMYKNNKIKKSYEEK